MRVVFSLRARRDIAEIYEAIAQRSVISAQRVEDRIRETCLGLADFPLASATTDIPGVRRLPLVKYPYTIYFRVNEVVGVVEIARVLHSARIRNLRRMPRAP